MITLKTGAVICKKRIADSKVEEYEALIFIEDIPSEISDNQLMEMLDNVITKLADECNEIIVRADVNSTSNEIYEQLKGLNNDDGKAEVITFDSISKKPY